MTSLCFSFSGQLRDRCPFFLYFFAKHLRGHISKKYTHTLVIFPLLLYDVVWVYATIACSCQERKMGKGKRKERLPSWGGGDAPWLVEPQKENGCLFFFSFLRLFIISFSHGRGFHDGGGQRENNNKKEGRPAHTPREKEKKKRHTKSSRQRKADARLLLSARGDAPKKWRSRHFGLGLDTTHFFPFSYPETHKIHLSFSFIIPSLRA